MAEFSKVGVLSIGDNLIYKNVSRTTVGKILELRVNNPVAYIVTVSIFDWKEKKTVTLYQKELDAGDTLTDTFNFVFNQGDALIVNTSSATTSYYIHGIE